MMPPHRSKGLYLSNLVAHWNPGINKMQYNYALVIGNHHRFSLFTLLVYAFQMWLDAALKL